MDIDQLLQQRVDGLFPHLTERQRRLVGASDAQALGYGGISRTHFTANGTTPSSDNNDDVIMSMFRLFRNGHLVLVTDKYVAPAIEGGDVNLAAFIAMRLADLGG